MSGTMHEFTLPEGSPSVGGVRLRCRASTLMSRVRRNTKLYAILRLRRARRLREALGALRKLARQRPTEAMVYFYLAVTLDNMGRERAAIPRYHRALRLDPRHPHTGKINLYLASS